MTKFAGTFLQLLPLLELKVMAEELQLDHRHLTIKVGTGKWYVTRRDIIVLVVEVKVL